MKAILIQWALAAIPKIIQWVQQSVANKKTKGKLFDKITKRKVEGVYPKWKLITSHVCRRSFATNQYGILPVSLIMQITAHST